MLNMDDAKFFYLWIIMITIKLDNPIRLDWAQLEQ